MSVSGWPWSRASKLWFHSFEGATVSEVARAVGYGSTEAMARAFRDAGIPSPSFIRDALVARRT